VRNPVEIVASEKDGGRIILIGLSALLMDGDISC
jgi:hypothetical protein